jgi:hypothetical protein
MHRKIGSTGANNVWLTSHWRMGSIYDTQNPIFPFWSKATMVPNLMLKKIKIKKGLMGLQVRPGLHT